MHISRLALTFGLILAFHTVAPAQIDRVPENTVNCADFRKIDASTWITTRLAHFDIGHIKGNGLPPNVPLQRGIFNLEEIDLVDLLDVRCAGSLVKGIQQAKDVDFTQTGNIPTADSAKAAHALGHNRDRRTGSHREVRPAIGH
jgi:hypothetical protein